MRFRDFGLRGGGTFGTSARCGPECRQFFAKIKESRCGTIRSESWLDDCTGNRITNAPLLHILIQAGRGGKKRGQGQETGTGPVFWPLNWTCPRFLSSGRRSDGIARGIVAYLARRHFGYSGKDVAAALGYSGASSVSQAIRRVESANTRCKKSMKNVATMLTNDYSSSDPK